MTVKQVKVPIVVKEVKVVKVSIVVKEMKGMNMLIDTTGRLGEPVNIGYTEIVGMENGVGILIQTTATTTTMEEITTKVETYTRRNPVSSKKGVTNENIVLTFTSRIPMNTGLPPLQLKVLNHGLRDILFTRLFLSKEEHKKRQK